MSADANHPAPREDRPPAIVVSASAIRSWVTTPSVSASLRRWSVARRGSRSRTCAVVTSTRAGFEVIDLLAGAEHAIIVDCLAVPDPEPGRIRRLDTPACRRRGSSRRRARHQRRRRLRPRGHAGRPDAGDVEIYGVESATRGVGEALSPAVQMAVATLSRDLHAQLKRRAAHVDARFRPVTPLVYPLGSVLNPMNVEGSDAAIRIRVQRGCGHRFEILVYGKVRPICPKCRERRSVEDLLDVCHGQRQRARQTGCSMRTPSGGCGVDRRWLRVLVRSGRAPDRTVGSGLPRYFRAPRERLRRHEDRLDVDRQALEPRERPLRPPAADGQALQHVFRLRVVALRLRSS